MKTAIVTGILGQDGAYLAELLVKKNYKVYGLTRKSNSLNFKNLKYLGIDKEIEIIQGDVTDDLSINSMIRNIPVDEFYNLAAQSSANFGWQIPKITSEINGFGPLIILESLKNERPECRFFQAGTSDMYGNNTMMPITEQSSMMPNSPYATAKLYAHWTVVNYREKYQLHATNGILFNHESALRQEPFLLSRIINGAVRVKLKKATHLELGRLDVVRDWGYAPDFVQGMWLSLQQPNADDYVFCTGRPASFEDIVRIVFEVLGHDDWRPFVRTNQSLSRSNEALIRYGDPGYTQKKLGWTASTSLEHMIENMVAQALKDLT